MHQPVVQIVEGAHAVIQRAVGNAAVRHKVEHAVLNEPFAVYPVAVQREDGLISFQLKRARLRIRLTGGVDFPAVSHLRKRIQAKLARIASGAAGQRNTHYKRREQRRENTRKSFH